MKKSALEHLLRAAGQIAGDNQFIIIGSQSLHGKFPDTANQVDGVNLSMEADMIAKNRPGNTDKLNTIGVDSMFHETHGYYADPVDECTATLPKGWKGRLVNLKCTESNGVAGLCLDPHDLAISKYDARREKDIPFTRAMAELGMVDREKLLKLLDDTKLKYQTKERVIGFINRDFDFNPENTSNFDIR